MPRLTNRVFTDLAIWMAGFGLFIGLLFPPFCVILGLPQRDVITPSFFTATLLAGLLVGAANFALAHVVVGTRLKRLTTHMVRVQRQLVTATRSGDWSGCNPLECALPVDSEDEIGSSAVAFNALIGTLAHSHAIESATRGFTRVVASHLELDSLARDSLATILKDTGATAGILLVEEEQGLKPLATVGISDPERVAANAQVTAALRSGQTLRLDIAVEQVVVDSVLLEQTAREVVVVPLSFKDVPLGALVLASIDRLAPGTELLIGHFQTDLGLALSNALSHHRLERLAALDPLTDAYNRRFGFVRLQEEFGRALRVSSPLGVLMVDLDNFKGVNDTYGHLVGDRILRAASASIRRVCREGDILIRYGGEEFMVVVPGAADADLLDIAERIRRSIAATEVLDGHHGWAGPLFAGSRRRHTLGSRRLRGLRRRLHLWLCAELCGQLPADLGLGRSSSHLFIARGRRWCRLRLVRGRHGPRLESAMSVAGPARKAFRMGVVLVTTDRFATPAEMAMHHLTMAKLGGTGPGDWYHPTTVSPSWDWVTHGRSSMDTALGATK